MKNNNILNKLNNQGRRKEEVYFNWMRGYLVCEYFKGDISNIFNIPVKKIKQDLRFKIYCLLKFIAGGSSTNNHLK